MENLIKVSRVFIGLGSNLGDGPAILSAAWQTIGAEDRIATVAISSPYISSPVAMNSRHWFTNCAGELKTDLPALELLQVLLRIEAVFGRTRDERVAGYQDRVLDLDLLFYRSMSLNVPGLILPHPRISERLFVLSPLAEIAPDWQGGGAKTIKEMEKQLVGDMQRNLVPLQECVRREWRG